MQRSRSIRTVSLQKFLAPIVAGVAVFLITSATPAAASERLPALSAANVCSPCQSLDDLQCGVVIVTAISHCCGMGNGNASCDSSDNKYHVTCNSGGSCTCGDWGDNCVRDP